MFDSISTQALVSVAGGTGAARCSCGCGGAHGAVNGSAVRSRPDPYSPPDFQPDVLINRPEPKPSTV